MIARLLCVAPSLLALWCYCKYVPVDWGGHRAIAAGVIFGIVSAAVAMIEQDTRP